MKPNFRSKMEKHNLNWFNLDNHNLLSLHSSPSLSLSGVRYLQHPAVILTLGTRFTHAPRYVRFLGCARVAIFDPTQDSKLHIRLTVRPGLSTVPNNSFPFK